MSQDLSEIKTKIYSITTTNSKINHKDIILYILNGLLHYQAFKIAIHINLIPNNLNNLYLLLYNEEINLINETTHEYQNTQASNLAIILLLLMIRVREASS